MGAAIGGAIGGVSSIFGAREAAKQQRAQIRANRRAAKFKYSAVLDSTNIMKAAIRDSTESAAMEAIRAGAATDRTIKREVTKAASSIQARAEGVTSGRSKGRMMVDTFMKGNEVLAQSKNKTVSMVNKLVEAQDAQTNQLNNRLLQSYQEMSAILANEGPDLGNNVGGFLSGVMGGATAGEQLFSGIGDSISNMFSTTETTGTTYTTVWANPTFPRG